MPALTPMFRAERHCRRNVGYAPPAVVRLKDMYRTGVAPTVILLFCNAMQFKWLASSWKFVPRAN